MSVKVDEGLKSLYNLIFVFAGDYLIYETLQTSLTTSEEPTNHSIVFYYIDSNFITNVKFVIYDVSVLVI